MAQLPSGPLCCAQLLCCDAYPLACAGDAHCALVPDRAEEFSYTRMGGSAVIEGVDDEADMVETQKTFALLGE